MDVREALPEVIDLLRERKAARARALMSAVLSTTDVPCICGACNQELLRKTAERLGCSVEELNR